MIKLTLHNSEDDELELGPFSQGVLHKTLFYGREVFVDVATSEVVAVHLATMKGRGWIPGRELDVEARPYAKAFIQEVPVQTTTPDPGKEQT